jgi:hypothetical protein
MATVKQVREERAAPIAATLELTEKELRRVMEAATADKVRCDQASDLALSSIGEAAVYTLAEKAQAAWREVKG